MKDRKNLKGFTLIELIIVMAIFGVIMTAALQIITPLHKLSKRATIQEANAAAVDNMKNYFEGSLRYADCVEVFPGGLCTYSGADFTTMPDQQIKNTVGVTRGASETDEDFYLRVAVAQFVNGHFTNRVNPGTDDPLSGKIRVLMVDNNAGGIVKEYTFDFTAGYTYMSYGEKKNDGSGETQDVKRTEPPTITPAKNYVKDVINPVYYDQYSFYFVPGYNEIITQDVTKDSSNFTSVISGISASDNEGTDYYGAVYPVRDQNGALYTPFSERMFSLSVVTYRNDAAADGSPMYRGTLVDDPDTDTIDESEYPAFQSPYALSNINMSLVNINSDFSKNKVSNMYGPERYLGKRPGTDVESTDSLTVVQNGNKTVYKKIGAEAQKSDFPLVTYGTVSTDSPMYFIYTLPDCK